MRLVPWVCVAIACVVSACRDEGALQVPQRTPVSDSAENFYIGMETNLIEAGIRRAFVQSDSTLAFDRHSRFQLFGV